MVHFSPYIIDEIKAQAARNIERIADDLLQYEWPHKTRSKEGLNYSRSPKGRSWTVNTRGNLAGTARHWSEQKTFDAIGLAQRFGCVGGTYQDALNWLANFLGIATDSAASLPPKEALEARRKREAEAAKRRADNAAKAARENDENIRRARQFIERSCDISGTAGERYLTEQRGLTAPETGWPSSLKWRVSKGTGYLVCVMTTHDGEARSGQRIQIKRSTGERATDDQGVKVPKKLLRGTTDGLAFRLPAKPITSLPDTAKEPLILAEGPETALSLWEATGAETWALMGVKTRFDVPGNRLVILGRDDDPIGSPADKAVDALKEALEQSGHTVLNCWPYEERREDKSDFNDILKREHTSSILARVLKVISILPPPPKPLTEARKELSDRLGAWLGKHYRSERDANSRPASMLIPVGVGIGKSYAAKAEAAKIYDPELGPIVYAVPNHELADQNVREWNSIAPDLRVEAWRGRDYPGMCENEEPRKIAQKAGVSVMKTLCTKKDACPFAAGCPYLSQLNKKGVDVWIVPHDLLFTPKPQTIHTPSLVIIDESFLSAGLKGFSNDDGGTGFITKSIDKLHLPESFWDKYARHASGTGAHAKERLGALIECLKRASENEGYLTVDDLKIRHFDAFDKAEGEEIGESPKHAREITNEITNWLISECKDDIEKIELHSETLNTLRHICGLYSELERLLKSGERASGRIYCWKKDGATFYRLTGLKEIKAGWSAPTLALDATANPEAIKHWLPNIEISPAVEAATPYAQFIHVSGAAWGKRAQGNAVEAYERGERPHNGCSIEVMRLTAWDRHLEHGGDSLTICNKAAREALEKTFTPQGLGHAHFGALVGLNSFKDVSSVDIYGRPLPNVRSLEAMSEAILGHPIPQERKAKRLDRVATSRETRTLQKVSGARYRHPDAFTDALLQELVDGQLIQAAGRARAVIRDVDSRVVIRIHSDTYPDALPLDAVQSQYLPSDMAKQVAAHNGLMPALESAHDAFKAYPDLWGSIEAASKSFSRKKWQFSACSINNVSKRTFPYIDNNKEKCPSLHKRATALEKQRFSIFRKVQYRPDKGGPRWRTAYVPYDMPDEDFRIWLSARLDAEITLGTDAIRKEKTQKRALSAPPRLVELHHVLTRALRPESTASPPFNGVDKALRNGVGNHTPASFARLLADIYLSDVFESGDEKQSNAILSHPLLLSLACYFDEKGLKEAGMQFVRELASVGKNGGWGVKMTNFYVS